MDKKMMEEANARIPEEIQNKVDKKIERKFARKKRQLGLCHQVWGAKKDLYKKYGYDWYAPSELNPDTYFD